MSAWLALPFVLVAAFWIAARVERRDGASFWRHNGAAVGTFLLVAIGLWALLLVALIGAAVLSFVAYDHASNAPGPTPARVGTDLPQQLRQDLQQLQDEVAS